MITGSQHPKASKDYCTAIRKLIKQAYCKWMTFLQTNLPILMQVNITADRRIEGCAPANKLNDHKPVRIKQVLSI
jgi:hypothetical protein